MNRADYHWSRRAAHRCSQNAALLAGTTHQRFELASAKYHRAEVTVPTDAATAAVNERWKRLHIALRIAARMKRMIGQALNGEIR